MFYLLLLALFQFCIGASGKKVLLLQFPKDGLLHLHPDGLSFLESIAGPVSLVSVIGPYRSGKSFLLNQLTRTSEISTVVFDVDQTTQPCTLGVFLYYSPDMNVDAKYATIYVDTFGLFAPGSPEELDARLMSIMTLMSSVLIYNHFGVLDSNEVAKFSYAFVCRALYCYIFRVCRFIVNYAKNIAHIDLPRNEKALEEWKAFMPDLIWLCRDFFLTITGLYHAAAFLCYAVS